MRSLGGEGGRGRGQRGQAARAGREDRQSGHLKSARALREERGWGGEAHTPAKKSTPGSRGRPPL